MASILVISFSDLRRDPRVRRQIDALLHTHTVTAAGFGDPGISGVHFVGCARVRRTLLTKILEGIGLALRRYERHYWSLPHVTELLTKLTEVDFELVVANDLDTLPLALRIAGRRPVVLDAHEYAPREFEDRFVWRVTRQGLARHLCARYLKRTTAMTAVCDGIAREYEREFLVQPVVIENAAVYNERSPRPSSRESIRMIHHGAAIPSRRIEMMIDLMGHLDPRFSLDLMLVPENVHYLDRLRRRAARYRKIQFCDPIPMERLVSACAEYDIGLFLLPPTNFNYLMALPNKFFEFIQSRLAVVIGPSPEMARIVNRYRCGLVAPDFKPETMARLLNALTSEDLDLMKQGSNAAARVHNAERNAEQLRAVVHQALNGRR